MRIRKKAPKPSSKRPPLYFIGFRGTAPGTDEVKAVYDREYGGPLVIRHEDGSPESWQATHGPWSAHVVMPLPTDQVAPVMKQLSWEHELMGAIAPSITSPREMPDAVLLAARLARCLTLLSQGTAYDVCTQAYVNPSDWQERPLSVFVLDDHVSIVHDDTTHADRVWSYSLGLSKFGMDEVELFSAKGLPDSSAKDILAASGNELLRLSQPLKVGTTLDLPLLGRTVRIRNYRTASPAGRMLAFRELQTS